MVIFEPFYECLMVRLNEIKVLNRMTNVNPREKVRPFPVRGADVIKARRTGGWVYRPSTTETKYI